MQRRAFHIAWIGTLVVIVCLGIRLLGIASRLETGLPTLAMQWRNSTLAWLIGDYVPVPRRPPPEQAAFWLAETERILREHANDGRLMMGAALVLDSPGTDFMLSHLKATRTTSRGSLPEMDQKAVERAEDEFEKRCRDRCLELAAKATELDPENVDWWRLRAILLLDLQKEPSDSQWLSILGECQRHDPDNSLYDYLAAYVLWEAIVKKEFADGETRLLIQDEPTWEEGLRRFERAQSKPFLAVGDIGFTVTAELLQLANIAPTDHPNIVGSRRIHLQRSLLIHSLWGWLFERAEMKVRDGDIPAALALRRQSLHLIAQHMSAGPSTAYDSNIPRLKVGTAVWMRKLAEERREAVSSPELEQIVKIQEDSLLEQQVLQRAARTLPKNQPRARPGLTIPGIASAVASIFAALAPQCAIVLLLVGLVGVIAWRWVESPGVVVVGPIGQLVSLAASLAATVVVFGLAPAEIIPREVQAWTFTILLLLAPAGFLGWLGWRFLRQRSFQFSLRAMLLATLILCLLFGVAVSPFGVGLLEGMPFRFFIPPIAGGEVDAASLGQWLTAQGAQPWWAAGQWMTNHGHLWTIVIWAGLVAVLHYFKVRKLTRRDQLPSSAASWPQLIAGILTCIARPALVTSALVLVLYLLIEPRVLIGIDRRYQQDMAFARDPNAYWRMVEAAVRDVREDEQVMAEIRKSTDTRVPE